MGVRIAIAGDHAGFECKNALTEYLRGKGFCVKDLGTQSGASVDYPDFAYAVTDAIGKGGADFGVLVCGTGIGMSMAANRIDGIRAALCTNEFMAQATRAHNDANILCLGARVNTIDQMKAIADMFLSTEFEGGRHACRVGKIRKGI